MHLPCSQRRLSRLPQSLPSHRNLRDRLRNRRSSWRYQHGPSYHRVIRIGQIVLPEDDVVDRVASRPAGVRDPSFALSFRPSRSLGALLSTKETISSIASSVLWSTSPPPSVEVSSRSRRVSAMSVMVKSNSFSIFQTTLEMFTMSGPTLTLSCRSAPTPRPGSRHPGDVHSRHLGPN